MGRGIKYLKPRGNVFYYVRRLPKLVLANPVLHQKVFGGGHLYRVSLGTSDQDEALEGFRAAHADFNAKLLLFTPSSQLEPTSHKSVPVSVSVTPELQVEIKQRVARQIRDRWLKKSITAEISSDHAELFEEEVDWREQQAEDLKLYLTKQPPSGNLTYQI